MEYLKAPDGYEIMPKSEYRQHQGDSAILYWSPRAGEWRERAHPGNRLFDTDIYARPIRKRTLWVKASERQPPVGVSVPMCDTPKLPGITGWWHRHTETDDMPSRMLWLDLDAADALEAERDRLAAQYAEHAARIAELEAELADAKLDRAAELTAENDLLRRERDALVDGLCRQGEWFRGMVRGLIGAREVN